jgi:hypothetical protein
MTVAGWPTARHHPPERRFYQTSMRPIGTGRPPWGSEPPIPCVSGGNSSGHTAPEDSRLMRGLTARLSRSPLPVTTHIPRLLSRSMATLRGFQLKFVASGANCDTLRVGGSVNLYTDQIEALGHSTWSTARFSPEVSISTNSMSAFGTSCSRILATQGTGGLRRIDLTRDDARSARGCTDVMAVPLRGLEKAFTAPYTSCHGTTPPLV